MAGRQCKLLASLSIDSIFRFFNASMQRDFIKTLLGPKLATNAVTRNINLMIMDDQRFNLPHWPNTVLSDPGAAEFVAGIAIHWYEDSEVPAAVILETHNRWPNYFMLATEACAGFQVGEGKPIMGEWLRAEYYAHDIITVSILPFSLIVVSGPE